MRCLCTRPQFGIIFIVLVFSAFLAARPEPVVGNFVQAPIIETTASQGSFPIVQGTDVASIFVDANDFIGVTRAASDLRDDIGRVTDKAAKIVNDDKSLGKYTIIVGTVGKSALIDRLTKAGKIDVAAIQGKWETYFQQVVSEPLPGVASALVIAGSDKRGTIFGIYDLSQQMGVSPWYWWSDTPTPHKDALFVKAGKYQHGEPSVKYRGIFLNDEKPDLAYWVKKTHGVVPGITGRQGEVAQFNSQFYGRLFELILRLKGNYLWPAMWNNAFNEDDPENPKLANDFGIVMGTSHQEPMLRAQEEWDRRYKNSLGNWNYATQADTLNKHWREGIRRNKDFESIITIGLRGENDTAMVNGPAASIALLDKIVAAQRQMIAEEMNPDVTKVPQMWCLYKEVQGYYEQGLRVPDDVTLLWADDNWGDIRRVPTEAERKRSGGAGIYYHFDYHGAPRSYQWVNTNPIPKIWEQMTVAKEYGADRIWIVNVGHFKGYELPMEYFFDLAWNTKAYSNRNLMDYTRNWAAREFGPQYAAESADILAKYTKYNGRRKPELLEPNTHSMVNYREAETVVADFKAITVKAKAIHENLPANARDSFYTLVYFPAMASAVVNEMYLAAGKNALYAKQGRASTNDMAALTQSLFKKDAELMTYYNKTFAGGKWDHFMDQSHIGYISWKDPPENSLGAIKLTNITVPEAAAMGIALDGSATAFTSGDTALPKFDIFNQQKRWIDVFNKGKTPFDFTATVSDPWIVLSSSQGKVEKDERLWVSVDWSKAPKGAASGAVKLSGTGTDVAVKVETFNPTEVTRETLQGFVEAEGFVSIEAEHFTKKVDGAMARWEKIEDYGRTLSAMTILPMTAASVTPPQDSPCLEYKMYLFTSGKAEVQTIVAPSLNYVADRGLRFAVSIDDQPPRVIDTIIKGGANNLPKDWENTVRDSVRTIKTTLAVDQPSYHTLKIWMVDPGIVVQKIVVNMGGVKQSYLGPPESYHR